MNDSSTPTAADEPVSAELVADEPAPPSAETEPPVEVVGAFGQMAAPLVEATAGVPIEAGTTGAPPPEPTISLIEDTAIILEGDSATSETTPSGFRKRRRGQEGAPAAATVTNRAAGAVPRRDPQEVHASLQRFRLGVEAGRFRNANHNNANPTTEGESQ